MGQIWFGSGRVRVNQFLVKYARHAKISNFVKNFESNMVWFGSIRISCPLSDKPLSYVGSGMSPSCSIRILGLDSVLPCLAAPPPGGWKVKVDAAKVGEDGHGCGVVIRDNNLLLSGILSFTATGYGRVGMSPGHSVRISGLELVLPGLVAPPPGGWKVNVDTAKVGEDGHGCSVVIRDNNLILSGILGFSATGYSRIGYESWSFGSNFGSRVSFARSSSSTTWRLESHR